MSSAKNVKRSVNTAQKKVVIDRSTAKKKNVRKKRIKKKPQTRANAIEKNSAITPVQALVPAQGTIENIGIQVNFDLLSVQTLPIGLLSMYASRTNEPVMFSVYKVIFSDVSSIILSGIGTAPSRFKYMQEILGALAPKNVPFARDCSVSYKALEFNTSPDDNLATNAGIYYMWLPTGSITGTGYQTQAAPPPTTDDIDKSNYQDFLSSLTGKAGHTAIIRDVNLGKIYEKDVSAFARVSPYYGDGAGVGAPYSSTELEVPFKSILLGTFLQFEPSTPRASQVLRKTSGDSCSNYAIGIKEEFLTSFYNGALPPIYKFLDLNELAYLLSSTIIGALRAFYTNNKVTADTAFLDAGFSFSYTQFLLMLRQQILWMFADSQSIGQCLSFQTGANSFAAFLCGSNCYAQEPEVKIRITTVANENLKMLKMVVRNYVTKKYDSTRNHITHIPVWGAFQNYSTYNFSYTNSAGNPVNLFFAESGEDPSVFDGSFGSDAYDLNDSPVLNGIPAEWNGWMNVLSNVFTSLDTIGGDGNGGPLLQYTRYVNYINPTSKNQKEEIVIKDVNRLPHYFKQYVKEREVLERKDSKNKIKNVQSILAIPDSTPFQEFTRFYSGMIPITATHKQFFPDLILPIIDVSSSLPSMTQVQVATREPHSMAKKVDNSYAGSRAAEIEGGIINHVVGLSGRPTALAEFMKELSNNNEGGFIGDLFSAISSVANLFGF